MLFFLAHGHTHFIDTWLSKQLDFLPSVKLQYGNADKKSSPQTPTGKEDKEMSEMSNFKEMLL